MKKILGILLTLALCVSLVVACDNPDDNGKDSAVTYEISVTNNSSWTEASKLLFFDLSGEQVASCDIESGKATMKLADGPYIVLVSAAPSTVTYRPALVTPTSSYTASGEITLEDSTSDGEGNYNYGVLGVLLSSDGEPASDYNVTLCFEPDDGSFGFCLDMITSDEQGLVYYTSCISGHYHVQISVPGNYDEFEKEEYTTISPDKRFFITKLDSSDSSEGSEDSESSGNSGNTGSESSGGSTSGNQSSGGSGNQSSSGSTSGNQGSGNTGSESTGGSSSGNQGSSSQGTEHTHAYNWQVTTAATCEGVGSKTGTCSCGAVTTEEIPALGHDWDESGEYKPATCTEKGYSASAKCRRCSLTRTDEEIPALGHDFGTGMFIDQEATCLAPGRGHVNCRRSGCNASEQRTIPICDHVFTSQNVIKQPDCTHEGQVQKRCKFGCGTKLDPETVPALGHDWHELEIISKPTCDTDGQSKHVCNVCKLQETYSVKKLGHVYGEYEVDTAATESSEGSMSRHCVHANCTQKTDIRSIEKIDASAQNVSYEFRLRRNNKFAYTDFTNVKFRLYSGEQLVDTINVEKDTFTQSVPASVNKLKVEGLKLGFSATEAEYTLDPGSPIVDITVKASVIPNENELTPEKRIDDGDVMYDFVVHDTKNADDHSKDKKLSELIEGKKLVMFDFFWIGCTNCSALMKIFNRLYLNELQPYRDDILVIMLDNIDYTDDNNQAKTDRRLEEFRQREGYSDDYVICKSNPENANIILQWFQLDGHNVRVPGHIWMDGEGCIYKLKTIHSEDEFRSFIFGFLDGYEISDKTESDESSQASLISGNSAPTNIFEIVNLDKPFVNGGKFN